MMFKRKTLWVYFSFTILLSSCLQLGLNLRMRTARHPAKLPRFTIKDSLKGSLTPQRACYDVNFYDIKLKIDPDNKKLEGEVQMFFTVKENSSEVQIDLAPQLDILKIEENGHVLTFTRKHTAVFVKSEDGFNRNENRVIKIKYSGKPNVAKRPPWKGGLVWKKDKEGNHWCAVACEGEGAWTWLPIKGYLGDEPDSAKMHFTVPSDLICVSNGNFLGSEKTDNNWTCFNWKVSNPINPYNITFYLGKFKKIETPYETSDNKKMNLEFYVLEKNVDKAKEHFKQAENILRVYESIFGPYPWPNDGYKLVESPYAGMEHQSAIAYGNEYKNAHKQDFDYIILHETAHEWWGNTVSVADFSDIWLHEGMASFAEALYVERTKGKKAYLDYIWEQATSTSNKAPIILPKQVYYWNYKDGDVYAKGSAILNTFRNVYKNDTAFLSVLKDFNLNNRNKNVTSEDFFSLLRSRTKTNLDPLIKHYFYKRQTPLLRWNYYTDSKGNTVLVCFFDRVDKDFTLPVMIEQDGKTFEVSVGNSKVHFQLASPSFITVNPNWSLFQEDRVGHLK